MHSDLTVAFEFVRPWPKRSSGFRNESRWRVRYDWATWRHPLKGWCRFWNIAGRTYYWPALLTVWHREPGGRDSNPPCKDPRWRWHIRHWQLQFHPWQQFRNRFERCAECNRRMNKAARFSYMSSDQVWHDQCMSLRHLKSSREDDEGLIRALFAAYRVAADVDEPEALERFRHLPDSPGNPHSGFRNHYRLERLLGWERDNRYRLVRPERSLADRRKAEQ